MYKVYIHRNLQIGSIFQQVDSTIADCGSVLFVFLCNHDANFTKTYIDIFRGYKDSISLLHVIL